MFRPRIIPVLLLSNGGLVKTQKFGNGTYIGDPINAVRIFNDLNVDEIVLLDIEASKNIRSIPIDLVKEIGEEANMPFSVGGGIKDISTIKELTSAGAERVILSSYAINNPDFIADAVNHFGSSTICICIDYKKNWKGKQLVHTNGGKINTKETVDSIALQAQKMGAGEVIIQSIEMDGTMAGYDIEMIKRISSLLTIPLIALGGAGTSNDIEIAYKTGLATGVAAGSYFVFKGKHRGVLIQYPDISSYKFD